MQFLCIGVNECAESIKNYLTNELDLNDSLNKKYSVKDIMDSEGSTSIICSIEEDDHLDMYSQLYNDLVINVSNALANYIIEEYEEKLILRTINSNYCYFNSTEKKEILRLALSIIKNEDKNFLNSLFQIRRRNIIIKKFINYIYKKSY